MTGLDRAAATAYLEAVYGDTVGTVLLSFGRNGCWDTGRYRYRPGDWVDRVGFTWPSEADALLDTLEKELAAGRVDVYARPYLTPTGQRRTKGNAVSRRLIHADRDGAEPLIVPKNLPGIFVVASGTPGHEHVYVPVAGDLDAAEHEAMCRALAATIGDCDAKVSDNDVLRLPGTLNYKSDPPQLVRWITEPGSGPALTPELLAQVLRTALDAPARPAAPLAAVAPAVTTLGTAALPTGVLRALGEVTGDRSRDTMRVVGACLDAGLTLGQARAAVATRADLAAGLAERGGDDVARCWAKATENRRDRPAAPMPQDVSDSRLAEAVAADVLAGEFVWCRGLGWLGWDGRRWVECSDEAVGEPVRRWAVALFAEIAASGDLSAIKTWNCILSLTKQRAALNLARGICERQAGDFDADPDLLNTPAGIVDLHTGKVIAHDPAMMLTKITSGNYRPGLTHPDWTAALEALPEDKRVWLQIRIGQGATGHRTPDGIIVILQGSGENGKSLLSTDGVAPALGDYATLSSAKLICDTNEHSEERASLRGKRLLVAEEMTEGRSLNITAIKQISDVGIITARHVYGRNMTFRATHTLICTTNYVPVIAETDHGTWRRLALLRFPYTFRKPEEALERAADRRGDPDLKRRIENDISGQHDAIVTWVVDGAIRWHRAGPNSLAVPASVAADTAAWRCEADRILGFWTERIIADTEHCILSEDLLAAFNDWLKENGHQHWAKETFAPRFEQHGETAKNRVERCRTSTIPTVSRYIRSVFDTVPPLPTQARIWTGVRFREASDLQLAGLADPSQPFSNGAFMGKLSEGRQGRQADPDPAPESCRICAAPLLLQRPGRDTCARCDQRQDVGAER
ncbi:phage/plasmid primase, P4 family [Sporichthya sp.]|uniref:DNA primase family protein n=1 Tax=Sporichthya sp. TaxID=65475 RepID=UPI0017D5BB1E|nr:phage/plasmid primase, P4 family [Sporichthya sp.]MBA3742494.1 hypothetical protein [Sporichthya sp.]